jgi:hypothetical protein
MAAERPERRTADTVYAIGDWRYEQVAPDVLLSWTGARHRLPEQRMRDGTVVRLIAGRDGLFWRIKLFPTRAQALAHLELAGPDLGL